jgi:hypothetical protein
MIEQTVLYENERTEKVGQSGDSLVLISARLVWRGMRLKVV